MEPQQELLQKWEARIGGRFYPRLEFADDGLKLGVGTILSKAMLDSSVYYTALDEPRLLALLATAYTQPVEPSSYFLRKIRRASELWNEGEKTLAHIHLAQANLPICDRDAALRLFLAEECLVAGVSPAELIKAQGIVPGPASLSKYSPDQPRVPAGNGRESGRWTSARAGDGHIDVATGGSKEEILRLILRLLLEAKRRFGSGSEPPQEPEFEPAQVPKPPTKPSASEVRPFTTLESDLPRPGPGKEVSIPGLPDDIKGMDITKPRAREANYETDLTRSEFEKKLSESGWSKELSQDGKAMNYRKDGAKYSVRNDAKSTKGPTADFYHPRGDGENIDMKLRLRDE